MFDDIDWRALDKWQAEKTVCPECNRGCHYESEDDGDGQYRAFAVCDNCGRREEF